MSSHGNIKNCHPSVCPKSFGRNFTKIMLVFEIKILGCYCFSLVVSKPSSASILLRDLLKPWLPGSHPQAFWFNKCGVGTRSQYCWKVSRWFWCATKSGNHCSASLTSMSNQGRKQSEWSHCELTSGRGRKKAHSLTCGINQRPPLEFPKVHSQTSKII